MTDTLSEPTGWWQESMPADSWIREASAQFVANDLAKDTLPWITTTAREWSEDYYATSAMSASAPLNSTKKPQDEQANTSSPSLTLEEDGLPLINLPDPEAWAEWLAEHQNP
jgi:hypothetical protein